MTQKLFDFDSTFESGDAPEFLLTLDEIYERADQQLLERLAEDRRIERKTARFSGDSLGEYFSMWANTNPDGGLIASGIANSGEMLGCKGLSTERLNRLENTAHVFCADAPHTFRRIAVTNVNGEQDFILLFRVKYHPDTVVKTSGGKSFERRGSEKHELTGDEIREMEFDKGQVSFEEQPCRLKYPEDFDIQRVRTWAAKVREIMGSGHALSDQEILANRHLGRFEGGGLVPYNACALLFAKDPRSLFAGCRIRVMRFEGETEGTGEKYNAVKDVWVEGTIPEIIEHASEVIDAQLRTFSPLKNGKFELVDEFPKVAWYEAVVNACVHRSYGNGMKNINIFVRMFDDHMEIESPGPFPPFVTAENVYQMHKPRNPRIMEALYFLGTVRMNREGTRRMRDTMSAMGLPDPVFSQEEIGYALVRVTLKNNIHQRKVWIDRDVSDIIGSAIAAGLSQDEKRILNLVAERGQMQVNDIVRSLDLSWQRADDLLKGLWKLGILQYARFRQHKKNLRDPKAFYRLRSDEPLPDGAHEPENRIYREAAISLQAPVMGTPINTGRGHYPFLNAISSCTNRRVGMGKVEIWRGAQDRTQVKGHSRFGISSAC